MKKINELKALKTEKVQKLSDIVNKASEERRVKTEEETKSFNALKNEIASIDADVADLEEVERLNKENATEKRSEVKSESKNISERFREFLVNAVENRGPVEFTLEQRADPILQSTQTGLIQKTVGGIDYLITPGFDFLRGLGVKFFTGLAGNLTLNDQAQVALTYSSEGQDASTANMAPGSITLAARSISSSQAITKATLAQTSPEVYSNILQVLVESLEAAVTNDLFTQLTTDTAGQVSKMAAANGLVFGDLVNMEASLGDFISVLRNPAYVMPAPVMGFLKQKPKNTYQQNICENNEINGYKSLSHPGVVAKTIWFGDWSRAVLGEFGAPTIVVDPYTKAASQQIILTVQGLYDSGCWNKRGFVRLPDTSIAI